MVRGATTAVAASAVGLLGLGAASGCGTDGIDDRPGTTGGTQVGCLYGGTPAPGQSGLAPAEVNAIVSLEITGEGGGITFGASCTGLLVSERWILTGAHCARDAASTRVTARFNSPGACQATAGSAIASAEVVVHPSLDLMLVRLAELPAHRGIAVVPVKVDAAVELHTGEQLHLAGFGRTEDNLGGGLRVATEPVVALSDDWIDVDGAGKSGACLGDSGGPLLRRDSSGAVKTVGVLSHGSASCLETDRYVRLRAASAWLAELEFADG